MVHFANHCAIKFNKQHKTLNHGSLVAQLPKLYLLKHSYYIGKKRNQINMKEIMHTQSYNYEFKIKGKNSIFKSSIKILKWYFILQQYEIDYDNY